MKFDIRRYVTRYNGIIRSFKPVYVLSNLLHYAKLKHNRKLYRKFGLRKSVFAPLGSGDFPEHSPEIPWIDRPGATEALPGKAFYRQSDPELQAQLHRFIDEGFLILKGFYNSKQVETHNETFDRLLTERKAGANYSGRKIMDAFRQSDFIKEQFFQDPRLLQILSFLLGREVIPFQTIHFLQGSEQRAHSDFIHMSTEPPGYLIAAWTALEDIDSHNGPLFYYPGSHRLPYLTYEDYAPNPSGLKLAEYRLYEERVEKLLQEKKLKKETFLAEKGDVLVWHANLLHGGSPIGQEGRTRRSMVAHYFAKDVICYHDVSQRPALLG